jgi:hypothetical protein
MGNVEVKQPGREDDHSLPRIVVLYLHFAIRLHAVEPD